MTVTKETASNIDHACKITRGLVAMHPVQRDMFPRYEAVQAWPLVAPLYNGLEQALKAILLAPSGTRFTLDQLKDNYGHDLKKLYSKLELDDRNHIELHFGEHWSLHDYDTHGAKIATAEQFITHINGTSKDGLLAWRYFLIDEKVRILPATSLWTMCEIWDAICCRIRKEVFGKHGDCSRLSRMLAFKFSRLVLRPVPYDEFTDEVNEWIAHKDGDHLAAWIDLFVKASHNALDEVQAPDRLRPELAMMADSALKQMASDSADPDEAQLLHRIQTDPNLTWDRTTATFRSAFKPETPTRAEGAGSH